MEVQADAPPPPASLKSQSARGALVSLAGQGARTVLQLLSTAALARLLAPEDYGLVALATVVTGFLGLFADPGLSAAAIQKASLDDEEATGLFWFNVRVGSVLTLVAIAAGLLLSLAFRDARVAWVCAGLGAGLLLQAAVVIPQSLLRRRLRFAAVAIIDLAAVAGGALVAVVLALIHPGPGPLVLMSVATSGLAAVLAFVTSGISLSARGTDAGSMASSFRRFATEVTHFNLLNHFARNADNLLIGAVWGVGPVGLYNRAYSLMLAPLWLVVNTLSAVATPVLARLQGEPDTYRRYVRSAISLVTLFLFPFFAAVFLFTEEIVRILLGGTWTDVAPILRLLVLAVFFQPLLSICSWNYLCLGRTRELRHWGVISTTVIVASFFAGLPRGPEGVAAAYALAMNALILPGVYLATRSSPLSTKDALESIGRPLLACAVFMTLAVGTRELFHGLATMWVVPLAAAAGSVGLALYAWWSRPTRGLLRETLRAVSGRSEEGGQGLATGLARASRR